MTSQVNVLIHPINDIKVYLTDTVQKWNIPQENHVRYEDTRYEFIMLHLRKLARA